MRQRLAILVGIVCVLGSFAPLAAAPAAAAAQCLVTSDEFAAAVTKAGDYPAPTAEQYNSMCAHLPSGAITSRETFAQFLAQVIFESDGLRNRREYRCVADNCADDYKNPETDVPGQYYYPRGYLPITGSPMYSAASKALFGDNRLVEDADSVARDEDIAWQTAFWFWKTQVTTADGYGTAFGVSTKVLNGGIECVRPDGSHAARQRYEIYGLVRSALELPGPGDERGCYN
ncbi:chitinase [Nocardia vulneris]|uniref:chitinase n=1 Tax=Nocardia vulneris TaxID=1141657 RepID=UPI000689EC44|nr:chitinase [Nocardia vulneris]